MLKITQYDSCGVHGISPLFTKKGKTLAELKYNLYICSKKLVSRIFEVRV